MAGYPARGNPHGVGRNQPRQRADARTHRARVGGGGTDRGIWLHGWAGSFVAPYVSSKSVAHLCGFLIVLFGALAAGALVNFVIGKVIRVAGVSWLDRLLGAGFGFVRAVLVAVALVMALVAFAPGASAGGPPGAVVNSRLAPYVIDAARVLVAMAPRELNDEFQNRYAQVRRLWQDALDKNLSRQVL
ncbi:MAG: CvpA family protein [Bryobacterales bacterium]|nr:CvpA family protein [Bryobacterales bacterium]